LNDWSPRPPMSYTTPTFGPLPGAAVPAVVSAGAVVAPGAAVPVGAVVPPVVAAGAAVVGGVVPEDDPPLEPQAAAIKPSAAIAASDVNRLVLRIDVSPLELELGGWDIRLAL
jgi:hypothetical protein